MSVPQIYVVPDSERTYRVRKANLPSNEPHRPIVLRVTTNADGFTISRVPFDELPVVFHRESNEDRKVCEKFVMEVNKDPDGNFVICKASDCFLPLDYDTLAAEGEWETLD
jgi:hypothetical protein